MNRESDNEKIQEVFDLYEETVENIVADIYLEMTKAKGFAWVRVYPEGKVEWRPTPKSQSMLVIQPQDYSTTICAFHIYNLKKTQSEIVDGILANIYVYKNGIEI